MTVTLSLLADTTNTPVWWLVVATVFLVLVTGALALWTFGVFFAATQALGSLGEVVRDRHVEVFLALGERWTSQEMTEALQKQVEYTPEEIAALFVLAAQPRFADAQKEAERVAAAKTRIVLLRVPSFFEDAATIAKEGSLDDRAMRDYVGGLAIDEWYKWEPTIKAMQAKEYASDTFIEFENLAKASLKDDEERAARALKKPAGAGATGHP